MKHGNVKRPTLKQKKIIDKAGLAHENWFVVKDTPATLEIVPRRYGILKGLKITVISRDNFNIVSNLT